ncbi:uncharacterized protein DS421_12g378850 [Arachis hypogaea]|nr:uncharacterized protein DS421_12g378850 [Arachis hypogaea]
MHDSSWREKNFTQQEKADQLLPANDPIKFANRYYELKYPAFANSINLYLERTLKIPEALQQYTTEQIKQRGWFFLERTLTEVNASWVQEFYCNYYLTTLDAVNLRGKQILVNEEALEDILRLPAKSDQPDGYSKAEEDMRQMQFDWDAVKARTALDPTVPWEMGQDTTMPRGIKRAYLNDEARLWHQILSNYVMPSTHETEISAAMITLLWCVLEDKDLYLPRFIRHYMARVHVRGTLPFPYLVIQLGRRADVPREDADERPPAADCRKIIPHSRNFLALGHRPPPFTATDESAPPSTGPSSSTATPPTPATTTAPPPATEPVYHLVHRLFRRLDQMERRNKQRYEHLKLMIRSGDIPSEPDTPSEASEEEADAPKAETHPQEAAPAAPQAAVPHQIEAVDLEIPIQSTPPPQQPDSQPTTTETPPTIPSSDNTPSHPA